MSVEPSEQRAALRLQHAVSRMVADRGVEKRQGIAGAVLHETHLHETEDSVHATGLPGKRAGEHRLGLVDTSKCEQHSPDRSPVLGRVAGSLDHRQACRQGIPRSCDTGAPREGAQIVERVVRGRRDTVKRVERLDGPAPAAENPGLRDDGPPRLGSGCPWGACQRECGGVASSRDQSGDLIVEYGLGGSGWVGQAAGAIGPVRRVSTRETGPRF